MKIPLSTVELLCKHYAPINNPDRITSSHALDVFADICASKPNEKDAAVQALELLSQKFDPIRTNYWNHRKVALQKAAAA
jgi:protein farnesyltransferase/geranylgeranyltransferase type-1 subunit alpha